MRLFYTDLSYANSMSDYLLFLLNNHIMQTEVPEDIQNIYLNQSLYEYLKSYGLKDKLLDNELDGYYKFISTSNLDYHDHFCCYIEDGQIKHILFDSIQMQHLNEMSDYESYKDSCVYETISSKLYDYLKKNNLFNDDLIFNIEVNDTDMLQQSYSDLYQYMQSLRMEGISRMKENSLFLNERMEEQGIEEDMEME